MSSAATICALLIFCVSQLNLVMSKYRIPGSKEQIRSPSSPIDYMIPENRLEPIFDPSTPRNVTVASGKTAYLPCRVRHLGERTISWIRKSDLHVLTVGKHTFTSDERFRAVHLDNSEDWGLQIRFSNRTDADEYICQVSGQQKQNLVVRLTVVLASAKIAEGPVVYMSSGSRLQLTCLVKQSPAPPDFIFWHHNGEVLSYDSHRGIRVQKENSAQATSKLIIEKAHPADSGNYSCVSDAAEAAHVAVHVSPSDGHPAAIQHGKRSAGDFVVRNKSFSPTFNFAILLMPFTVFCFT